MSTTLPVTDRQRALALHHANLIQERKDVEAQVLEALEELIEYPLSPNAGADEPKSSDLEQFQQLIRPFQVSDYDDLIEERNAADKCGYVFCPKPLPRDKKAALHSSRILRTLPTKGSSKGNIKIVPASKFEMWCSKDCAKRAMYIKVQLSETPAWERSGGKDNHVKLLKEIATIPLTSDANTDVQATEKHQAMTELAIERGDKILHPVLASTDLRSGKPLPIREKTDVRAPSAPNKVEQYGGSIEGYMPKHQPKQLQGKDEQDEVEDGDWDLT